MSENTRDWNVTLTIKAYLDYNVEADDEESAIEMAIHEYETEGDGFYDLELSRKIIDTHAYVHGMY